VLQSINLSQTITAHRREHAGSAWSSFRMRYFFHAEGSERVEDEAGLALPTDSAAIDEARALATLLNSHDMLEANWRIVVINERGKRVIRIPVSKMSGRPEN
jgi:hypothetical protein